MATLVCYCPCQLNEADLEFARTEIIEKAFDEFRRREINYIGVLSVTIMLTANGLETIKLNCLFGDLEIQVLLALLETHLYDLIDACCNGQLTNAEIAWKQRKTAVAIVMASEGYPHAPKAG